jgi:type II secretory pathway pseudopilin PulG
MPSNATTPPPPRRDAGFTLLQAVVALAIMAILTTIVTQSLVSGTNAITQSRAMQDVETTTQTILNYALADLRASSLGVATGTSAPFCFITDSSQAPAPLPLTADTTSYVQFYIISGWTSTPTSQPIWTGPIEYWFQYSTNFSAGTTAFAPSTSVVNTGSLNTNQTMGTIGVDKNGDGKINLGLIVRRQSSSTNGANVVVGSAITIASNVVEGSFSIRPVSGTLASISVTCARQLRDQSIYSFTATNQTAARTLNP